MTFAVSLFYGPIRGGFQARKGSIIGSGVSNIIDISVPAHLSQCLYVTPRPLQTLSAIEVSTLQSREVFQAETFQLVLWVFVISEQ